MTTCSARRINLTSRPALVRRSVSLHTNGEDPGRFVLDPVMFPHRAGCRYQTDPIHRSDVEDSVQIGDLDFTAEGINYLTEDVIHLAGGWGPAYDLSTPNCSDYRSLR